MLVVGWKKSKKNRGKGKRKARERERGEREEEEGRGREESREKCFLPNSPCSVNTYPRKLRFIGNGIYGLIAYQEFTYNSLV